MSQRLKKPQQMIPGWQVEVREHHEAEICVCLVPSVFPDTFLGTVQGSATANGLTRGSGVDHDTNSELSPYTRTNFEAGFLAPVPVLATSKLQTHSRLGHALGFQ